MPSVSIITISMNQRHYLERCVSSVQGQSFEDFEHIVVDPGSRDGSQEWVASLSDPRIRLITEPDNGPAQGLNNGVKAAQGGIILYLNADDALPPEALHNAVKRHEQYPRADVIIGNGWTIGPGDEPIAFVRSDKFTPLRYSLGIGTVLQQATSIKRGIFDQGLTFNESNRFNWDSELLFDAFRMGASLRRVPDTLGYFRLQPESITMSGLYEAGLTAERRRLREIGLAGAPRFVATAASPFARAAKKVTNSVRDAISPPSFPGTASKGL